jgi:predicted nucleotidyltransferase
MTSREQLLDILRAHSPQLRSRGVKSLWLFGSFASGKARAGSDIDLVVEFDQPTTFDLHMGLWEYLEGLLGRRVDLLTLAGLKLYEGSLVQ